MVIDSQSAVIIALLVLGVALVVAGVKTVAQGQEWTVERLGRYTRTLKPGLNLILPFVERIGHKFNVMEVVLNVPSQEVISRDNATVEVDGIVFYQILDTAKAAYEVQNLTVALTSLAMTNVRSVIGSLDLDEVLSQRDQINQRLLNVIDQATSPWGVKVSRIELSNIQPPANLLAAMAKQMTAEREKRADILAAEGAKQSAILRAEGEKQAAILQAEGKREAAFREAEARERMALAEAEATRSVSTAIAAGDIAAVNYFVATRYIEALQAFAQSPNQKTLMLPVEATGILGALSGITDLVKDAAGRGRPS